MSKVNNTGDDDSDYASSTILTSRFGYASAKLIHTVEKNLYIVLAVILSIASLSLLNTLGILNHLYSENVDYFVDIVLSIVLIAVVAPLVYLIVKSRRVLDNWNDMFERNTISTSLNIAMTSRSGEDVLRALSYSIEEIAEPLQGYIESKKSDLSEFLGININGNLEFDILLESNRVIKDGSIISNALDEVLRVYGSVVVKIINGIIDQNAVESFVYSLSTYTSLTKNQIGLSLILGEEITRDARQYANKVPQLRRRRINNLLLLAKPSILNIHG
jgi:hypothetical protein